MVVIATLIIGVKYSHEQISGSFHLGQGKPLPLAIRNWSWWKDVPKNLHQRDWPLEMMALSILGHTNPNERVVIKDIGFPGFLTMNPIWDQAGLVTPVAAELRHRVQDTEVRDRYVSKFLETGAASLVFFGPTPWPHVLLQQQLFQVHPDLRDLFSILETPEVTTKRPRKFERLALGFTPGFGTVLKNRNKLPMTPREVLANLERRLGEVSARFPEYKSRASETLEGFRRYLKRIESSQTEDGRD
jgi:hypothetical protein